jgi:hypothetical protein
MRKQAKKLLLAIALLSSWQAYSQVTPHTTTDYHLEGYPKQVRYMKFESDSALKNQRTSFIEDYQLTFNDQRLLIERTNYINGKKDRYSTYEYDNNRQLFKETLLEANNKIVSVTEYTYNYLGRIAEITTIEYPQSRGGANTVVRHESYEYNKKGQQIKHIISSDNSKESRTTQFFYGPQDSLIYTITTYSYNKNVDKVTYKRDFKHSLIEKINIRNDKQTRRETYSYNDKGLLEQKEVYNGKYSLDNLKQYISIGKLMGNTSGSIKVIITLPTSIDNDLALEKVGAKWIFYTEGSTQADIDVLNPDTGDNIKTYIGTLIISSILIFLLLIIGIKNKKESGN